MNGSGRQSLVEEREREEEQEYAFLQQHHHPHPHHQRPVSRASDSASVHFLTDDRLQRAERPRGGAESAELFAEDVAQIRMSEQVPPSRPKKGASSGMAASNGQVDYSPGDFQRAKAAIEDAAARQRQRGGPPERLRRVKQIGDTTVITEHRDPYSFYWQLDKLRKAEEEPPRAVPPADYVLEEEEEEQQQIKRQQVYEEEDFREEEPVLPQQQFLSPDSGVHFPPAERGEEEEEQAYARPVKVATEDPAIFSHYWHVDSGPRKEEPRPASRRPPIPLVEPAPYSPISPVPSIREPVIEEHAFRQTTTKRRIELAEDELEEGQAQKIQFKVRWLGHLELDESQLDGVERSQATLNRAMAKLEMRPEREVLLEVGGPELRLLDEKTGEEFLREPVQRIRCWAVGRENPRGFAFVSHEPGPRGRSVCQVFRCEEPAKSVAEALGNACGQLLRQQQKRPDSLGSLGRRRKTRQSVLISPMQEPKRVIRCHFIGVTQVPRATGIGMLNEAVDGLLTEVHKENWTLVDVHVSPSSISIFEALGPQRRIASCRVRYLSFLGIGRDVKHAAFIVAQSEDHFVCYVFHAEPSAVPLAKTIEAACKLRYQKVLDSHLGNLSSQVPPPPPPQGPQLSSSSP